MFYHCYDDKRMASVTVTPLESISRLRGFSFPAVNMANGWEIHAVGEGPVLIGDTATFRCDYMSAKNAQHTSNHMIIEKKNGFKLMVLAASVLLVDPNKINERYTYDMPTRTLTIRNVQCGDEAMLVCRMTRNVVHAGPVEKESEARIIVKARPSAPEPMVVTTVPDGHVTTASEAENAKISASCTANVGRPGKGTILWRIFRNGVEDRPLVSDPRISVKSETMFRLHVMKRS